MLWSLVAITVILQFYRLGIGDLIAWDESLYVIRAKAILEFGAWLDQTPYAIGGLYSSTHPPLAIWLMALFVKLFGETLYAWRLVSALSAVAGLFFLYKLSRIHTSERASLMGVIAMGNAQQYLWYGHHAQLDIPMQASVLASVWLIVRALRSERFRPYFIAGIPLGLALLIKAFQGLYVAPMVAGSILFSASRFKLRKIAVVLSIGVLIALPWYYFILREQSLYITDYFNLVGSISSGEYDSDAHPWWYYFNQFVMAVPLFLPLLIFFSLRDRQDQARRIYSVSLSWLGLMFILLTAMGTKMPHWTPFLIIPAAITLPYAVDGVNLRQNTLKHYLFILSATVCTFWSLGLGLRNPRMLLNGRIQVDIVLLAAIMVPLVIIAYLLTRKETLSMRSLLFLSAIIAGGNLYRWSHWNDSAFTSGAKPAAAVLDSAGVTNLTLLHADAELSGDLYGEFSYYSNGWTLGWRSDRKFTSLTWFHAADSINAERAAWMRSDAILIHHVWDVFARVPQRDSSALATLDSFLRKRFTYYRRFARYEAYY